MSERSPVSGPGPEPAAEAAPRSRIAARIRLAAAYALGLGILVILISRMPFGDVMRSIEAIGPSLILVFCSGPLFHVATASSLWVLFERKVSWAYLWLVQFIVDSYNQILPLAGLGGEPLKIHWLQQRTSMNQASHAVVIDRLLHVIPGPLFAAIVLPILVARTPMDSAIATSYLITAAIMAAIVVVTLWATFSPLPGRVTDYVVGRLFPSLVGASQQPMPRGRLFVALLCKSFGQVVLVAESWLILRLLGFDATVTQVLAVSATVTTAAVVFFFVPQQLGVNEASLAATFSLLGLPPHLGLALGLLRRARQTFWPLCGLATHGIAWAVKRVGTNPAESPASPTPGPREPRPETF